MDYKADYQHEKQNYGTRMVSIVQIFYCRLSKSQKFKYNAQHDFNKVPLNIKEINFKMCVLGDMIFF